VATLLPRLTRPAFRRRSPAGAGIMADWVAIVGPRLAAVTAPRRLSGTALTIGCAGPVAMELQHLAPQLIGRINAALGEVCVRSLRFVQDNRPTPPPPPPPVPPASLPERVGARLAGIDDPALRDALARLAGGVYRGR